jgi:hypothetical protein
MIYTFEINVAKAGQLYVWCTLPSNTGLFEAQALVRDFKERFPKREGFLVSVTLTPAKREHLTVEDFLALKPGQHYLPPTVEAPARA